MMPWRGTSGTRRFISSDPSPWCKIKRPRVPLGTRGRARAVPPYLIPGSWCPAAAPPHRAHRPDRTTRSPSRAAMVESTPRHVPVDPLVARKGGCPAWLLPRADGSSRRRGVHRSRAGLTFRPAPVLPARRRVPPRPAMVPAWGCRPAVPPADGNRYAVSPAAPGGFSARPGAGALSRDPRLWTPAGGLLVPVIAHAEMTHSLGPDGLGNAFAGL